MLRNEKEIYKRIDGFVLQSLLLIRKIPQEIVNREIMRQLIRSVSSIGANAREAQASQTRKEFIRCFSISKREAKESHYWFTLLFDLNPSFKKELTKLVDECDQITAILSAIIFSTKKNSV